MKKKINWFTFLILINLISYLSSIYDCQVIESSNSLLTQSSNDLKQSVLELKDYLKPDNLVNLKQSQLNLSKSENKENDNKNFRHVSNEDKDTDKSSLSTDLLRQLGIDTSNNIIPEENKQSGRDIRKKYLKDNNTKNFFTTKTTIPQEISNSSDISWLINHSCADVKKFGREKDYCLKIHTQMIINKSNQNDNFQLEATLSCLKDFCNECCNNKNEDCFSSCNKEKRFFSNNTPQEIFKSVCKYDNMKNTFNNFCDFFKESNDLNEYDNCFKNFCFDCCIKEIGSSDVSIDQNYDNLFSETNLVEDKGQDFNLISNCMKQCFPIAIHHQNDKYIFNSVDQNSKAKQSGISLLKQSKDKLENAKRVGSIDSLNIRKSTTKILKSEKPNKINDVVVEYDHNLKEEDKSPSSNYSIDKMCDSILLKHSNLIEIGKSIKQECLDNSESLGYTNSVDCINALCSSCCENLEFNSSVIACKSECLIEKTQDKVVVYNSPNKKDNIVNSNLKNNTVDLSKEKIKNDLSINSDQTISFDISAYEKELLGLNKTKVYSQIPQITNIKVKESEMNLLKSKSKVGKYQNNPFSIFYTIRALCEEDYFSDCFEILCSDYCNNSTNIINDECEKQCVENTNKMLIKENSNSILEGITFVINRHSFLSNKFKNNPEISFSKTTNRLEKNYSKNQNKIEQMKNSIKRLKLEVISKEEELLKFLNS